MAVAFALFLTVSTFGPFALVVLLLVALWFIWSLGHI
jgi:hypothetical protein